VGAPRGSIHFVAASLAATLAAATLTAATADAQRVRGALRDATTGDAVLGAVVWLGDSTDRFLARGVSRDSGRFDLPRLDHTARLHVLRIGYQPIVVPVDSTAADSSIVLDLTPIALRLAAVASKGRRVCPGDAGGEAGLEIWNQARAALYASIIARELTPPAIRVYSYVQTLDPVNRRVIEDSSDMKDLVADKSYVAARPAWAFASDGYARDEAGGARTYFAPDEAVLFDSTFVETHCLHSVTGSKDHDGQVGVAFEPITDRGRDTLVDIRGTLWIDADKPRLRTLEFTYTGLEPAAKGSGGDIRFSVTPRGTTLIDHWQIRTAVLANDASEPTGGLRRRNVPRTARTEYRVVDYMRMGGELVDAAWSGTPGVPPFPRIVGTVVDSGDHPVAGARVWWRDGRDTVTTDAEGKFEMPRSPPAVHVVVASDTALARLGIARTVPLLVLTHGMADFNVRLVYHSRADVMPLLCPTRAYRPGTGVVLARIVTPRGEGIPNADVAVFLDSIAADLPGVGRATSGRSDPNGSFAICGVTVGHPLQIRATKGESVGSARIEKWSDQVMSLMIIVAP
jgi:hypothetical protein